MASPRLVRSARLVVGLALPAAVLLLNSVMGVVMDATLGAPPGWRVAIAVALMCPVGVLMGAPFPLGMMLAAPGDRDPSAVRAWYWAMNGMASVFASVLALASAMTIGFVATVALGAGMYALAGVVLTNGAASAMLASPRSGG
jgi:hypothetical protein